MGQTILFAGLAAAAVQTAQPAPPAPAPASTPQEVGTVVVQGRVPVVGDLQKGVLNFRPEFFVKVRPSTALDMIQWLPGFDFKDTRDMRGLDGAGGNVLIDGKPPASKTDTLMSVLRRIPSEQVERVDIIVGGAPGIDMRGWPVMANVILKQNPKPRSTVTAAAYLDRHGRVTPSASANFSRKQGGRTLEGSLEVGKNIAIYPTFGDGPWVRRDASGALIYTADTRITAGGPYAIASGVYERPLAGGTLKLNASGRDYGTNIDEVDVLTSGPGVYGFTHRQTYLQGELGLGYDHPLGKGVALETQALERLTHFTSDNTVARPPLPSELIKSDDPSESVLRATMRFRRSDKLTLAVSAEGALNTDVTHSAETVNGAPTALPTAAVDVRERRGETGATLAWKPNAKVSLDAALKFETSTLTGQGDGRIDRTFSYLKPRAVFTWSPDKDSQVRLRVEHEVGQIAFGSFAANSNWATGEVIAGNTDLRPQRAWVAEAALQRKFWTGGDLSLTLRQKSLVAVTDFVPLVTVDGVLGGVANIGDGHQTEVALNLTLPLRRLGLDGATLKGSATWSRSRVTDPISGLGRPLSGQPGFIGELHFAEDLPALKLNLGFDAFYLSPLTLYLPLGNQAFGAWGRFNLFVEYRIDPTLNLRAEVDNLPGTGIRQTVDGFAGVRDASALLYRDDKSLGVGPLLFVRVRRTFQ